jgi:hypothetical protein
VPRAVGGTEFGNFGALLNFGATLSTWRSTTFAISVRLAVRMRHGRTGILILNLPLTKYRYAAAVI